jgi:ubiquinone/menaquinone biosynthesis C-methylase UbiE
MSSKPATKDSTLVSKIRAHWDQQADEHGEQPAATMPDHLLRDLEIATIAKYITNPEPVLDLGCGNGFSTLAFAERLPNHFLGFDLSERMIAYAEAARSRKPADIQRRVEFRVGDATAIPLPNGSMSTLTTDRCLINLPSVELQRTALEDIARVLKPGGRYIMCEHTRQGLDKLNGLRRIADLPEITTRWHNVYLDEDALSTTWESLFQLELVDNFSSLYYVASRIFNARLAADEGKEPSYDHPLNVLATKLPSFGDYGSLKAFVLRKL